MALHTLDPDVPPAEALQGLGGLVAGGLASSAALAFTTFVATRGMPLARLRLRPGRERGEHLVIMVVGMLSLGQALDSLAVLTGVANRGAMEMMRRALAGASGPNLFAAVVVIGVLVGIAEEAFFRGYMQSLLRERWRPATAVVVTSLCFALLHLDTVHAALAFVIGLYLGFVTEISGSALPAATCHVVNNCVFTLLTALVGSPPGVMVNLALLSGTSVVFAAAVVWLRRSLAPVTLG